MKIHRHICFIIFFANICFVMAEDELVVELPSSEQFQENDSFSTLDFNIAVNRALNQSLLLNVAQSDVSVREGERKQATLYPNPVFSYEVENFAGNRNWKGWDNREERYFYGQLFETGGKRAARIKAASYKHLASLVGYEFSKLNVLNRLSRAFINVAAAQELLDVIEEQKQISHEVLRVARQKVEAGKASLIQQNKAEVAYASAEIEFEKAKVDLQVAKRRLALIWGSTCPDFDYVNYPFFDIQEPVTLEECLADLCNQPEIVQALYNNLNAQQQWRLEKANRVPDVVLTVGYKAGYEHRDEGLIGGISFPIPIHNQNQGNIQRAYFEMVKTGEEGKQLWLVLESRLSISYDELVRAYKQAEKIKHTILNSGQALQLAHKGYVEGKLEYLEVLDAQRTLFDLRTDYIEALINYHHRRADIDYLNSQMD